MGRLMFYTKLFSLQWDFFCVLRKNKTHISQIFMRLYITYVACNYTLCVITNWLLIIMQQIKYSLICQNIDVTWNVYCFWLFIICIVFITIVPTCISALGFYLNKIYHILILMPVTMKYLLLRSWCWNLIVLNRYCTWHKYK